MMFNARTTSENKKNEKNSSRALINALKQAIKEYCATRFLTQSINYNNSGLRQVVAKQNIDRLEELEKKYGDSEIPREEIMTCLISTGPSFSKLVYHCFDQFPETEDKNTNLMDY
ncbi:hypothetical protein [Legionella gresilensis]|uniref:hypothetical protein n=1 Tax=Legionella gresilensis TaxID=91823 RepID=UPI00104143A3|nr:hypothetical protein [Legionella gresilensis]